MIFERMGNMTDDLISRKAALELLGEPHPLDHNAVADVQKIIALPAVEAVPMDMLCNKLAVHLGFLPCDTSVICGDYEPKCTGSIEKRAECWKRTLAKWMEEIK